MFEVPLKLFTLLTHREKIKLCWLTVAIIIMAAFDMLGIASIFPFLKVVSDPDVIQANDKLRWLYNNLGFTDDTSFIIALGGLIFGILVLSNLCRAFVMVKLTRFTWMRHYSVAKRLLTQYLYEPYTFFLNRNSADLTTHLMAEVGRVISCVLIPFMNMFARVIFVLLIFFFLIAINPWVTFIITAVFGGGYGLIYFLFRKRLFQTGRDLKRYSKSMYKALNESFGGIKDIKLMGKENSFIEKFSQPARKIVNSYCSQFLITTTPRYAFEVLAFGGMLLITIISVVVNKNYQQAVPMIGLYALAAYRIMPALQQIFQAASAMRYGQSALNSVVNDIIECKKYRREKQMESKQALPFYKNIEFRDLAFQYFGIEKHVIKNFNLVVKANTTIGLAGGTGAGKTTLVDILLGLLTPQAGEILVDGTKITEDNLSIWQRNIGYVPQHIYLMDDTITRNIAFGILDDEIDQKKVVEAARLANIHDFIEKKLPKGYESDVGERGVRLSGGERQRIGIARALYHNPALLVFDEATSALDGITESAVLEAIYNLAHKKTIVIIAHRLTSLRQCDTIYLLEEGNIVANGTYQELLMNNQLFKKMAKAREEKKEYSHLP